MSVRYRFESASICSMRFRVFIGRGGEDVTAEVWLSMMKNEGSIEIGDLEIQMKGKGVFSPEFAFSRNDQVIATGSIPLAFRTRIYLWSGGRHFETRPRALGEKLEITDGQRIVGHIRKKGVFNRRGTIELDEDIPAYDGLFLLMLAAHYWKMVVAAVS